MTVAQAIAAALGDEVVAPAAGAPPAAAGRAAPPGLTPREVEVLRLLARGAGDRAIAAELSISPKTVGVHVSSILAKTGCANRTAAAAFAVGRGLA